MSVLLTVNIVSLNPARSSSDNIPSEEDVGIKEGKGKRRGRRGEGRKGRKSRYGEALHPKSALMPCGA